MYQNGILCHKCQNHQPLPTCDVIQTRLDIKGTLAEWNWFTVMDASPKCGVNRVGDDTYSWMANYQNSHKRYYCSPSCWVMERITQMNRRQAEKIAHQWLDQHCINSGVLRNELNNLQLLFHPQKV